MVLPLLVFVVGILIIVYFSEKLVEATVGTSLGFGISSFLISVTGIAVGTIIGSAMVAIALAFGITAIISPMKFESVPMQIPLIQVGAVLLFGVLSFDGVLTRIDGLMLLAGFAAAIWYLIYLGRRGLHIRPTGEAAEVLEEGKEFGRWQAAAQLAGSLVAIIVGSEFVIWAFKELVVSFRISDTVAGLTILALMVSIEEVARELPAAMKGRPEITVGNVIGSVLAFFLFNAGIIALVRPIPISTEVFRFYLPLSLGLVLFVTFLMIRKSIPRWAGVILLLGYAVFFARGYLF